MDEYKIECTGNCIVGDEVCFEKNYFAGGYKTPKFSHRKTVTAKIVKESYGSAKQQHTFTLLLPDGKKLLIKDRNLYRNGIWRKKWADEKARKKALEEKYEQGEKARKNRELRKDSGSKYL